MLFLRAEIAEILPTRRCIFPCGNVELIKAWAGGLGHLFLDWISVQPELLCSIYIHIRIVFYTQETAKPELPAASMKLIHSGKVLKDVDKIESCNIKPNDFLVVMIAKVSGIDVSL